MKYLRQFCIILVFTFTGEILQDLISLPIPAAVYGLFLLLAALHFHWVDPEGIRDTANFLLSVMPALFIAPAVNLLEYWDLIAPHLVPVCFLVVSSTVLTFATSGRITQLLLQSKGAGKPK